MKRLSSILLVFLGIGLVLLGLLFLIGAGGRGHRYLVAVVSLAAGGALAGFGIRLFKQADAASPVQLEADILALAKRENGEVSEGEVMAALGPRAAAAAAVVEAMVRRGQCERRTIEGASYLLFRELQPRLMVRRCEYCSAELPLAEEVAECPNCGGTVKTQVESRSLGGEDVYRMDE